MTVIIEDLYARDDKLKREDVLLLQEWLETQPHLPPLKEYQILAFIHSCYYRIDDTKTAIDKYFTMRTNHPEIFNCLCKDLLRSTFKYVFASVLPEKTPEGYSILLVKVSDTNSSVYNFSHMVTAIIMVLVLYWHQTGFAKGGFFVFDSQGFSFKHLMKINLGVLKHIIDFVQEGAPMRVKGVHYVNVVPAIAKLNILAKPFLKNDFYDIIHLHSSMDGLYKQVPLKCLPEDYGGQGPSLQALHEENLRNLLENYEYFDWHDSQKVDESKRPRKSRWSVFGWNY